MSGGELDFGLSYETEPSDCLSDCSPDCRAVHRRHTGRATFTISGEVADVRRAAALVFPEHFRTVDSKPIAPPVQESACLTCVACGADSRTVPIEATALKCPECIANDWEPLAPG